jgi:hypothetical protein
MLAKADFNCNQLKIILLAKQERRTGPAGWFEGRNLLESKQRTAWLS